MIRIWFVLGFVLLLGQPGMAQSSVISGPLIGHTESTSVQLWLQTDTPAKVTIYYWETGHQQAVKDAESTPRSLNTAKINLTELKPGSHYQYQIYLNGQPASDVFSFKTQPLEVGDFTVALGSCVYITDGLFDITGYYHGREWGVLRQIPKMKPDLMLWLGDNIYLRGLDMFTIGGIDYRYRNTRKTPEIQAIFSSTANYAIWDDHDFGPNDANRTFERKEEALATFSRYWANPSYGTPNIPGTFFRFRWGDVEFFMTDDRYYRSPEDIPQAQRAFFGQAQLDWLKQGLTESTATFKLVASGNQLLNSNADSEALPIYEREYQELMAWLKDKNISGVVFLSGDRHYTELLKLDRPGTYPLYEFSSSPLVSGMATGIKLLVNDGIERENSLRVPGTLVDRERNFGLLKFQGSPGDRHLIMETYNKDGKRLWTYSVSQKELGIPPE